MRWLVGDGWNLLHTGVKAVLLFAAAVLILRFGERRTLAELAPFDFVAAVCVGAIIGRTATAKDASVLVGLVALLAVVGMHAVVNRLRRHRLLARAVDQPASILVVDGELQRDSMRHAGMTDDDVLAALRTRGVEDIGDVRYLVFEGKGAFSVVHHDAPRDVEPAATVERIASEHSRRASH